MDRERLTELLQNPSQVAKEDLVDLRSMTERFPWFSGAHLLLALGEHETGEVLANNSRGLPAAFLPSRSVLFDLVRKEEPPESASLRVVKDEEPLKETPPVDVPPAAPTTEPTDRIRPLPAVVQQKDKTPEVKHVPLKEAILPAKEEVDEVLEPLKPDIEREVLDRQIVEAMHASGYELVKLAQNVQPKEVHLPKEEEILTSSKSTPSLPASPAPVQPSAPSLGAERPTPGPNTRLSFTDWLSQDESACPEEMTSPAPVQPEVALPSRSVPATGSVPDALSQVEIMEHFIQHSTPALPTEKAVFFNPQQAAKRSLQDDGLVSETLARIHEKQGNFAKAREVYDRLAVKHPEKSVYFAALSKALEARSNK